MRGRSSMARLMAMMLLAKAWFVAGLCTSPSDVCTVTLGVPFPQDGFLISNTNDASYFSFTLQLAPATDLEISASSLYGTVTFYAKEGQSAPTETSYDFSSIDDPEPDVLVLTPDQVGQARYFTFMVKAITESKFRVLVASSDTSSVISLSPGLPQKDAVAAGETSVFEYIVPAHVSFNLTFVATPFSGTDVDLYVLDGISSHQWHSNNVGPDYIVVQHPVRSTQTSYQVSVYGSNSSVFTIVGSQASETNFTMLLAGLAQDDYARARSSRFYVLQVPAGHEDVSFTLALMTGDADLFVNPSSSGFYVPGVNDIKTWSSAHSSGTEFVSVASSDSNFISSGGSYYITIVPNSDTFYSLTGFSANTVVTLREGSSASGYTPKNGYHYYRFYDLTPQKSVEFDLAPLSGDADLYVACRILTTGDDTGFPSKRNGHSNFSSDNTNEDTLFISHNDQKSCNKKGVFYAAVFAYRSTTYTLTAVHYGGTITLRNGVPVTGTVFKNLGQYFQYYVGSESIALTVTLTPSSGDTDLFVRLDGYATTWHYDFSSIHSNLAVDQVTVPEARICSKCWVSIYVYGYKTSTYSVVASEAETIVSLRDSYPQSGAVEAGSYQYYSYLPASNGTTIITLTVLTGGPVMYVSTSANMSGPDTVQVNASNIGSVPQVEFYVQVLATVYVSVFGSTNSSYTLRATSFSDRTPTLNRLLDGVPQSDKVSSNQWVYYLYPASVGFQDIRVLLSPFSGNVDLYIRRCPYQSSSCVLSSNGVSYLPTQSNYTFASADSLTVESVTITRQDVTSCSYIIGVFAETNAQLSISASSETTQLLLQPGVPVTDHVLRYSYSYFKFFMDQPEEQLTVSYTVLSGDPDLFISTSAMYPTYTNYTWKSTKWGADSIVINTATDHYCYKCMYYIGVFGYLESTYAITAALTETLTHIYEGMPQQGSVGLLSWKQYVFYDSIGSSRTVKVTVTPLSGDTDLYVTLDGRQPSFSVHDYKSSKWFQAEDTVQIKPADPVFQQYCADGDCEIRIGIYGFLASTYTLTVSTLLSHTRLQPSQPYSSQVSTDSYEFFSFQISQAREQASFTVTPFSGHVTLFASCTTKFPNSTVHEFSLNTDLGHTLILSDTICVGPRNVYASVYGVSFASFTIVADSSNNTQWNLLLAGVQQTSTVSVHQFTYFTIRIGAVFTSIHITTTVLSGDADMYVSTSWESRPRYDTTTGVTSYKFTSSDYGSENLVIRASQVNYTECPQSSCEFVVGLFGVTSGSNGVAEFTVLYVPEDGVARLQSGVPLRDHVDALSFAYYKFTITQSNVDLIISVTPFSGDPDIYINPASCGLPTMANSTWAVGAFGADTITLQADELALHCTVDPFEGEGCLYYIGIYGWLNTSFSLLATLDEGWANPIQLVSGQPQTGHVAKGRYMYYKFTVPDSAESVTFSLTSTAGGDQDLYITFGSEGEPGRDNYAYKSTAWSGVDEIQVDSTMQHYCHGCTAWVAVYGYKTGDFSIVVSQTYIQLREGVAQSGLVPKHSYRYYTFYNKLRDADIVLELTALTGDPDLYVGLNVESPPTRTSYKWRAYHFGDDKLTISHLDMNYCYDCTYIVGVYGWQNSSFTLLATASESRVVTLAHNRPQSSSVLLGHMRYFSASVSSSTDDISISASVIGTGSIDLYITDYQTSLITHPTLPLSNDSSTYKWTTAGLERDQINLPSHYHNATVVLVGVFGITDAQFSIVAAFSQSHVILQAGVPQEHYVSMGAIVYFLFNLDELVDLHITLTAITGDPDLLVSTVNEHPYCQRVDDSLWHVVCGNYTYKSASYATDQIIISKDLPCKAPLKTTQIASNCVPSMYHTGPFYISVYGYKESRFTITASKTGQHMQLVAGRPQQGVTSLGYVCSNRTNDGHCVSGHGGIVKLTQISYFAFKVNSDSSGSTGEHVALTVFPNCNASMAVSSFDETVALRGSLSATLGALGATCAAGCSCNPLKMYVQSCLLSECGEAVGYPSDLPSQHSVGKTIDPQGSTVFIEKDEANPDNGYCDSSNTGDVCVYYVAVEYGSTDSANSATFTIVARTPDDVTLVPCSTTIPPDGVRLSHLDVASPTQTKYYEVCATSTTSTKNVTGSDYTIATVEQCSGEVTLVACDSTCASLLPTLTDWLQYSNASQTCTRLFSSTEAAVSCVPSTAGVPALRIPVSIASTYYLGINGTGSYNLRLQTTFDGQAVAPYITDPGEVTVSATSATSVSLSWNHAFVTFPGLSTSLLTSSMTYTVYVIDTASVSPSANVAGATPVLTTSCGLAYFSAAQSGAIHVTKVNDVNTLTSSVTHDVSGLKPGTSYDFVVVATCDGGCLRQLSKTDASKAPISCSGLTDCTSASAVYSQTSIATTTQAEDAKTGSSTAKSVIISTLVVGLLVLVAVAVVALVRHYMHQRQSEPQYTLSSIDNADDELVTVSRPRQGIVFFKGVSKYQPLLQADDSVGQNESALPVDLDDEAVL